MVFTQRGSSNVPVHSLSLVDDPVASNGPGRRSEILTSGPFLFSVLALLTIVTAWLSNSVLPPAAMARIAEQQTGLAMSIEQIEDIESRQWIGYLIAPVALAARLALGALVIQGVGMLIATELRFRMALKASIAGGFAALYATWMNLAWLWTAGPKSLSLDVLGVSPVSLAGLLMSPEASRTISYGILAEVSLTAIFWVTLVGLVLQATGRLTWRYGLAVGVMAWLVMAAARIGLRAALSGLVPGA
jgi:hypothetical protein